MMDFGRILEGGVISHVHDAAADFRLAPNKDPVDLLFECSEYRFAFFFGSPNVICELEVQVLPWR